MSLTKRLRGIAQILKAIEPFDIHTFGHNSTKAIQVITEAERRAYADRSYFLGDPDFVKIPMNFHIFFYGRSIWMDG